jgi:uncharacterized protein
MATIWLIFGIFMLLSWLVGNQLKSRFKKYSQIPVGYTGREIAEMMLSENGIYNVHITSVDGQLTDHYNPATRTINLSPDVYHGDHVAAAAVAAHETGHAIQHARAFSFLQLRSALVPVVSIASRWVQWILLAGILLVQTMPQILFFGIILFGLTTAFSVITLPVEVDASKRALVWLKSSGVTNYESHGKAEDALKWAAYTYVIAALASLATLLYYVMIFLGATRD